MSDEKIDPAMLWLLKGFGAPPEFLPPLGPSRVYYAPPEEGTQVPTLSPYGNPIDVPIDGKFGDRVKQMQGQVAAIRKKPISQKLENILNYAASKTGVYVAVMSGGQAEKGSGEERTGSKRHDHGNAADIKLFVKDANGKARYLSFNTPEGLEKFKQFAKEAASAGATGIGAGVGYMGDKTMHVGFGKVATWGGASWVQEAFREGRENPVNLVPMPAGLAHAANDPQYGDGGGNRGSLRTAHSDAPVMGGGQHGAPKNQSPAAPSVKPDVATVPT